MPRHTWILSCLFICASLTTGAQAMKSASRIEAVLYSDFGAIGDGKTDDIDAIIKAHDYANKHGLPVRADDQATYYIGGQNKSAIIQTNTDFSDAKFLIDDTAVENRGAHVFVVRPSQAPIKLDSLTSLTKGQAKIERSLPQSCIIQVENSHQKQYIRYGSNQNDGKPQSDSFIVDKNGNVDEHTPIIWDFDQITAMTALPIDEASLSITGGRFTTIANRAESKYTYYKRGIGIERSNVTLDGLEHRITGEGEQGAPYMGFISIIDCANVTIQNCALSGHKTYRTIGSAGRSVPMGSYDLSVKRAINVSFVNCSQINDITNTALWGIMASNYCKNLVYDGCTLSRFDAHMGVLNARIRNSTIGHAGIQTIGHGTLTIENTTVHSRFFINLRTDYGSTWQGEWIIRKGTFVPSSQSRSSLIGGANTGQHDFGYTCHMPERITLDQVHIHDSQHSNDYRGPTIFSNFNSSFTDDTYIEQYPYIKTKEVILKDVSTASGKPLRLSDNLAMFKGVDIQTID